MDTNFGWDLTAERELWAAICAPNSWHDTDGNVSTHPESLWYFTHIAWGCEFVFQSKSKPRWLIRESKSGQHIHDRYLGWLQQHILEWKQNRRAGVRKRKYIAIILPRNFGKSVTATRCASLWTHLDDPNMSTLIGSATSKLSTDFLNSIGLTISGGNKQQSWFCWLYGNWKNPAREWTKTAFHHALRTNTSLAEPSFDVTAVDIGMTGYHHDQHWWDDPIVQNKLRDGGTYLETVQSAFNASYKALQNDGLLALVCTRYLDDDIAGRKFRDEGIASWTGMENPNSMMFTKVPMGKGAWHVYFWQVEDELTEKATCPEIMDEERIRLEKDSNPEEFACQYQNNPGTSTHAPLTEIQVRDCFLSYKDFKHQVPIECASIHLDTAFKAIQTIRSGDSTALVTFLHDARPNGLIYLHTDLLRVSNAWRSEEFSDILIGVMKSLRAATYRVKCITDEKEFGGKEGIYKQNLMATLKGAGFQNIPKIIQFNRQGVNKRARIRKAAGLWADGYVRILLHKDPRGEWILPPAVRELLNQMMRIDVVTHDDIADAAADVFMPEVWRKPIFDSYGTDEGIPQMGPGDEGLKALSRPLTNEEVKTLLDDGKLYEGYNNGLGPDDDWMPLPEREMYS